MKSLSTISAALMAGAIVATPVAMAQEPQSEDEKTTYAIGFLLGEALTPFGLSETELKMVMAGLSDRVKGNEPKVSPQEYQAKVQELRNKRVALVIEQEKAAAAAALEEAKSAAGATATDSGLIYREVTAGTGAMPAATDTVRVHYRGTLRDGTVFDSSYDRGQPASFPLNGVIPCWTEGLQLMKVGTKAQLTCPSDIAYGDRGAPPRIPGGAVLTFEVELLEIVTAAE
ncbi:MAG: FKBP-type peptidyl-prolyl cis-trans isomerase [Pseudomonadota bacterium]